MAHTRVHLAHHLLVFSLQAKGDFYIFNVLKKSKQEEYFMTYEDEEDMTCNSVSINTVLLEHGQAQSCCPVMCCRRTGGHRACSVHSPVHLRRTSLIGVDHSATCVLISCFCENNTTSWSSCKN